MLFIHIFNNNQRHPQYSIAVAIYQPTGCVFSLDRTKRLPHTVHISFCKVTGSGHKLTFLPEIIWLKVATAAISLVRKELHYQGNLTSSSAKSDEAALFSASCDGSSREERLEGVPLCFATCLGLC